ncbi:MAG: tRNA preQ1(34) S-adenosylmethionine ribosyltransferase-isomerase QueA, partial [Sphingomonadales bacterium]
MKVSDFNFELPGECIALRPARPRDSARMLVVRRSGELIDKPVRDLAGELRAGDVLVFNDTKVIPARLRGKRGEVTVEVTLHKWLGGSRWAAFARPGKRLGEGNIIAFEGMEARLLEKKEGGEIVLEFADGEGRFRDWLETTGEMPLPPYIASKRAVDDRDKGDYQTLFASEEGAVAAPTAGLHFTPELFAGFEAKGIRTAYLTLHVGAGTFLPVKAEDTSDHRMHAESGEISHETAERLNQIRAGGGRIVAVGTTALRLLESASDEDGLIHPFKGETDIFITPGYRFRAVDLLFTNFHLPASTLFMLVSAFSGLEAMKAAYTHAIDSGYRFYSYGDA